MSRNSRKRDLYVPTTSSNPSITLKTDPIISSSKKSEDSVTDDSVIDHVKSLDTKVKTTGNVYVKLAIGIPESRYFEQNLEEIEKSMKENIHITSLSVSETMPGVIERFLTINGTIIDSTKACLYISHIILKLNNLLDLPIKLQSHQFRLSFYMTKLDKYTLRQIENRAKPLKYFEALQPTYYSPLGNSISNIEIMGTLNALFDFLVSIIDSWPNKFQYIEDSNILQIPMVYSDDSNLYQTQEVNKGKLQTSIQNTIKSIYEESS